eukprot:3031505-Rhodomonas_salina.1
MSSCSGRNKLEADSAIFWLSTNVYGEQKLAGVVGLCATVCERVRRVCEGQTKFRGGGCSSSSSGEDDAGTHRGLPRGVDGKVCVSAETIDDSYLLQQNAMLLLYECIQTCECGREMMGYVVRGLVQLVFLKGHLCIEGHDTRVLPCVYLAYDAVKNEMQTVEAADAVYAEMEKEACRGGAGEPSFLLPCKTRVEEYKGPVVAEGAGGRLRAIVRRHLRLHASVMEQRHQEERGFPLAYFTNFQDVELELSRKGPTFLGVPNVRQMYFIVCAPPPLALRAYESAKLGGVHVEGCVGALFGLRGV